MVGLSILLVFVLSASLTAGLHHLALRPFRRASSAHWTERARLFWPVRHEAVLATAFAIGSAMLLVYAAWPRAAGDGRLSGWLLAGIAGGVVGGFVIDRAAVPARRFHHWLVYVFSFAGLREAPTWIWLVALVPLWWDSGLWPVTVGAALFLQLWTSCALWVWPLRWLGLLRPAPASLYGTAGEVAQAMGVRVRHVWETSSVTSNALALPFWGALVVNHGTVQVLSTAELRSVLPVELARLSEPWHVRLRRMAGPFWFLPLVLAGVLPFDRMICLVVGAFAFSGLQQWALLLSQKEERRVDALAAQFSGDDEISARAWEKLHEAALIPAAPLDSVVSRHPLYDRMIAAGITPDYERPRLPERVALNTGLGLIVCLVSLAAFSKAKWPPVKQVEGKPCAEASSSSHIKTDLPPTAGSQSPAR